MTEIEKLKEDINILQMKLKALEELQRTKSPAEEAFRKVYYRYPDKLDDKYGSAWDIFEKGYNASQKPEKEQQIKELVRESVKWCEEHREESVEDYLTPKTPEETEKSLREAFQKVQQTEEWKETQRKIDGNCDEIEWGTAPPEPTSTVFRKKLFDGIKSVFYDPDYEGTHWKLKVDMAVDEILLHFYNVIPEPYKKENLDEFEKGWNCCLASIEMYMEYTDD